MKKTLRFMLMGTMMLFAGQAVAEEVTIDFDNNYQTLFPTIPGVSSGTDNHDGDFTETTTSTAVDGVTVTVSTSTTNTANRLWGTSPRLRMYGGTFTVSGPDITKIEFSSNNNFNLTAQTGTLTDKTWTGEKCSEVVFTVSKNTQLKSIVVTLGGEVTDPGTLEKALYSETFTGGLGKFTTDDKVLPEGLNYVWSSDSRYGAKASAYYNATSFTTESWLISPVIDLSLATETKLCFSHALNKFASADEAKTQATVLVKTDDGEWSQLEGVNYPEELSWTYVDNTIDIASWADGKKIQVAFKYTSNESSAGTWEITPFEIRGKGEAAVEQGEVPGARQKVGGIAELLTLGDKADDLCLTLTDAKVLFNDGNYIYLRENESAVCFYQVNAVKELFKNNAVVNGTIRLDYQVYKLLPEVKANNYTSADSLTVTESEEEAVPVPTTVTSIDEGNNVCDLVTLTAQLRREVKYKTDSLGVVVTDSVGNPVVSTTTYWLDDDEASIVVVNNSKNLKALADGGVTLVTVTGIVNTNNNAYQIKLTKNAEEAGNPLKIYLFGSYANDTFREGSDYDFYLIVDDNAGNELDIAANAYLSICKIGRKIPVDILVGHHSTFEERRNKPTVENEVYKTGVLLYANDESSEDDD